MTIQEHVDFLIETAAQFEQFYKDEEKLFEAINQLDDKAINALLRYYDFISPQSASKNLMPVNFVRNNILLKLKQGKDIDGTLIEEIKEKFMTK